MSIGIKGVGGIFVKVEDPKKLQKWYEDNFGFYFEYDGVCVFDKKNEAEAGLVFALFDKSSDYFGDKNNECMINFWVEDLDAAVEKLKENKCNVDEKIDTTPQGKFAWVTDPEGNRIELWEPAADQYKK